MTHAVELPALDGRDTLGFLAALGTVRLLTGTRLSFSPTTATAVLHGPYPGIEEIVNALHAVLDTIDAGAVIPTGPARLPLPKLGSGPDPMRVTRTAFPDVARELTATSTGTDWLGSLVTDLALDNQQRIAISPYMAPSGQQSVRTFFANPLDATRAYPRERIEQALNDWRRIDGFTGEYLDHRVLNSAADHPTGKSTEAGVPAATWLATMALPLLRVTSTNGITTAATGWHRLSQRRQPILIWPLWRNPISPNAIQVLLEHPALQPRTDNGTIYIDPKPLPELGIFTVCAAERQPVEGRKFAGALAPCPIQTSSPPRRKGDQQHHASHDHMNIG